MTDLQSLISQLESAQEGSRELDRLIGEALDAPMGCSGDLAGLGYARFTTSLDAAISLVPEGYGWTICGPINARYEAFIGGWHPDAVSMAPTAALALCIASLRSLSHIREMACTDTAAWALAERRAGRDPTKSDPVEPSTAATGPGEVSIEQPQEGA